MSDVSCRVAIVDSGVDPQRVQAIEPGVGIRVTADHAALDRQSHDELGHGTAIAAAVRRGCADASLYPVRLFRGKLVAPVTGFIAALDWATSHGMHLVCLSIGVTKLQWRESFEDAVDRARRAGVLIVSSSDTLGAPCLPGIIPGVLAVRALETLTLDEFGVDEGTLLASPRTTDVPLRPRAMMPSSGAMAVGHATGALARWFTATGPHDERACLDFFSAREA